MKKEAKPPGPKGLPLIGSLLPFFKDITGFLKDTASSYGDIAYFRLGPREIYLLSHPDDIQDVLIKNNRNFLKSRALQRAKIVVGEGLLTSEKEAHLENRRIIQPIFHNKVIPEFAKTMAGFTNEFIDRWKDNEVRDIHRDMMEITQRIVVKTLLGSELDEESSTLIDALSYVLHQFPRFLFPYSEYLDKLPLPANIKCFKAIDTIDNTLFSIMDKRKSDGGERYDLLSVLLGEESENEKGKAFSNKQIRDELITFYIAGQETTSNALCWAWYLISKTPEVEEKIAEEIEIVLGDRLPVYGDIGKLKYIQNTVNEALRMYPPAWTVSRRVIEDYEVRGYKIPSGADIYMSQIVVHYDPRFYNEPNRFNPDRWNDIEKEDFPRFAFFPFGGGTRRCIGEPFAMMEAVILIAVIASRWRLKLKPGFRVVPNPLITLRPKYGLEMTVQKK